MEDLTKTREEIEAEGGHPEEVAAKIRTLYSDAAARGELSLPETPQEEPDANA